MLFVSSILYDLQSKVQSRSSMYLSSPH